MNKYLPAYTAALALAACSPHTAADTGQPESIRQPETQAASEATTPKPERKHQVDEAKIARNMAAWDKLMATPEQQYPSFEELEEQKRQNPRDNIESLIRRKRNNEEFAKHAVPLKQILSLPNKGIASIEVFYGGMAPPPYRYSCRAFFRCEKQLFAIRNRLAARHQSAGG